MSEHNELDQDEPEGFAIELPPTDIAMSVARSAVRRVIEFDGQDAESSFLVALTEIVANAIDEHRRSAPDDRVVVDVRLTSDAVVTVRDRGVGLKAELASGSSVVATLPENESGRGLSLARSFVPDLEFVVDDTGTSAILPLSGFGRPR